MNRISFAVVLVLAFLAATNQVPAAQPHLHDAMDNLKAALRHVNKSATETPKKHLNDAVVALKMAKTNLDIAKKNKGSHTHVALEKIDLALTEVEVTQKDSTHREKASQLIQAAIEETAQGIRAGK